MFLDYTAAFLSAPNGWPTARAWGEQNCVTANLTINPTPPLRSLWPAFDFNLANKISVSWGVFDLLFEAIGWALSDAQTYTRAGIAPISPTFFTEGNMNAVSIEFQFQFEYLTRVEYDPTVLMSFVLGADPLPAPSSSGVTNTPLVDLNSTTQLVIGVSIAAVIVGLCLILLVVVLVSPKARGVLMPWRKRRVEQAKLRGDDVDEATPVVETASHERRQSDWRRYKPESGSV